jgi:hypothetical protein
VSAARCDRCERKLTAGTVTGPASGDHVCRVCAGLEQRELDAAGREAFSRMVGDGTWGLA